MECGRLSKEYLIKIIGNKKVKCKIEKKPDQYNRKLGECFVNNKSLSSLMVRGVMHLITQNIPKINIQKIRNLQSLINWDFGIWSLNFHGYLGKIQEINNISYLLKDHKIWFNFIKGE